MPRTFISYRQESPEHVARVRKLALDLEERGIEVILDQLADERHFHGGGPDEGWHHWSIAQVKQAQRILMIGSREWFEKFTMDGPLPANPKGKGAASEARTIHGQLVEMQWVTSKHRIVRFDPEVAIPPELSDWHHFDGQRDLEAIARWLKAADAGSASASQPCWPARDDSFPRLFANRDDEWATAQSLISSADGGQVLLVNGPSGCGKSHFIHSFLGYAEKRLGRQHAGLADCRGVGLEGVLGQFCEELDAARLFPGHLADRDRTPRSFGDDLRSINEPLLLILDTFEQASDDVRAWVQGSLLLTLRKNEWIRVVIAGQEVPPFGERAELAGLVRAVSLGEIADAQMWKRYCEVKGWQVPASRLRAAIKSTKGRPLDMVAELKATGPAPSASRRRASAAPALSLEDVLQAAAIPHRFDASLLGALLDEPAAVVDNWMEALRDRPEIEWDEARAIGRVHDARRAPLRESLHRTNPDRFRRMTMLMVERSTGPSSQSVAERLFHRLLVAPREAIPEFIALRDTWVRRGRPEDKRLLGALSEELLGWAAVDRQVRGHAAIAVENLLGIQRGLRARRESLITAVADLLSVEDEQGVAEARSALGNILATLGERAKALEEFRQSKDIMLRLVQRDPDNADWQRDLSVSHNHVGRMLEAQGERAKALEEFRQSKDIMLRLVQRDPDNADWQRDLSVSHNHVGRMLEAQGERAKALEEFRQYKDIMLRLVQRDPDNADWQRDLSVSHNHVGRMLEAQGERAKALEEFRQSKDIMLRLVQRDPDNADWQRDLSVSHNHVGRMLEAQGERAKALEEFRQYKDIMLRLVQRDPDNADWQRDLSVSHNHVGRMLEAQGERAKALEEFRQYKDIMLRLVQRDPDNADWQRDLSVSHNHVGRMLEAQGERAKALEEFRQSKDIMLRLVQRDPDNADWQRDLSVSHNNVGRMLEAQGERAKALEEFRQYKDIMLRLVQRDPDNADWQRDLSVSHNHVGRMLEAQGERAKALEEFRQYKDIMLRLVQRDPDNADWQRELSVSHNHVGRMLEAQGERAKALEEFRQYKDIMLRLVQRDPDNADWQRDLSVSHNHVGRMLEAQGERAKALEEFRESVRILELLVRIDPQNAQWQADLSAARKYLR